MNKINEIKLNELIQTKEFIAIVCDEINELHSQRKKRIEPPAGKRYVRDWYNRMSEQSILNSDFFISNIFDIWMKKSNLSSEFRNVILYVCNKSLNIYLNKITK